MNPIQAAIKSVGSRYMPPNAIHWSDLSEEQRAKLLVKAPDLNKTHGDWLLFKIPRSWTTWLAPFPPRKIVGNAVEVMWKAEDGTEHPYCKPIPLPGEWFETAGRTPDIIGYHADTTLDGLKNRTGARFDDEAGYMTWPTLRQGSITNFFKQLVK